jgi:glyceraldehyde 3-phosphate dehydrogenase
MIKKSKSFHVDDISVTADGTAIVFKGKEIPVYAQPDPTQLNWTKHGVDIVLECTGRFRGKEDASVHLQEGVKAVIISAPADKETPMFVYGVNTDKLTKDMTVISGASCTTNALAPVVKVLDDNFGVERGLMTTVHAYTNDQTIRGIIISDITSVIVLNMRTALFKLAHITNKRIFS